MAKYIKGKDGKFKGNLPESPKLASKGFDMPLPTPPPGDSSYKCCGCPSPADRQETKNGWGEESWNGTYECSCHASKRGLFGKLADNIRLSDVYGAIFD